MTGRQREPGAFLVGPSPHPLTEGRFRVRNAGNYAYLTPWMTLPQAARECEMITGHRTLHLRGHPAHRPGRQQWRPIDAVTLRTFTCWEEWALWAAGEGLMPPPGPKMRVSLEETVAKKRRERLGG